MGISKRHDAWNTAIRDTFYSPASSGKPVYLDLDDEVFAKFEHLRVDSEKPAVQGLVESVLPDLNFEGGNKDVLNNIDHASKIWFDRVGKNPSLGQIEAPPMLGFLAISVLAAERMGAIGSTQSIWSSNAYYPHLYELLNLEPDSIAAKKLHSSFAAVYLRLWGRLNTWLQDANGEFGLPTAYAISHPYVGAAMSQALVRDVDRRKLPNLFASYSLEAHSTLEPDQVIPYIEHAVEHKLHGLTTAFRDLWKQDSARSGLAQVIVTELSKWDGSHTLSEKETRISINGPRVQLVAKISSRFGQQRINFSLLLPIQSPRPSLEIYINGREDQPLEWHQVGNRIEVPITAAGRASSADLFESSITVTSNEGHSWNYTPSFLVIFELSEDGGQWLQVPKISMSQLSIVAIKQGLPLAPKVQAYLHKCARPGYTAAPLAGSPEGWDLVRDVEVVTFPTEISDQLRMLEPVDSSIVRFEGGIKIPTPGTNRRWLINHAPRVRLISPARAVLKFVVYSKNEDGAFEELETVLSKGTQVLDINLNDYAKSDGEYALAAFADNALVRELTFKVGSWRNPDLLAHSRAPRVAHQIVGDDMFSFATTATTCADPFTETNVAGICSSFEDEYEKVEPCDFGRLARWTKNSELLNSQLERASSLSTLQLDRASKDSCVFLGNHNWQIDTVPHSKEFWTVRRVTGRCIRCGTISLFPATFKDARAKPFKQRYAPAPAGTPATATQPSRSQQPKVEVDWHGAMNLVRASVHGTYVWLLESLQSLATAETSPAEIALQLEALGHIEILRSDLNSPKSWTLSPPHVVLRGDRIDLIGNWPQGILEGITTPRLAGQMSVASFRADDSFAVLEQLRLKVLNFGYSIGANFSECLPALSEVRHSAPRSELPAHDNIRWFDLTTRTWIPKDAILHIGAYRIETKMGRKYLFVDENYSKDRRVIFGSASMVKWFAVNVDEGENPVPYQYVASKNQFLLAADMPLFGLYARALHAESGKPAFKNSTKLATVFFDVNGQTASNIQTAILS